MLLAELAQSKWQVMAYLFLLIIRLQGAQESIRDDPKAC
jgi:hypothetical protein